MMNSHHLTLDEENQWQKNTLNPDKIIVDDPLLNSQTHNHSNLKPINPKVGMKRKQSKFISILLTVFIAMILGTGTGFGAHTFMNKNQTSNNEVSGVTAQLPTDKVKNGDIFGSTQDNFSDQAEGYLQGGGIDGEGSHSLLRPGGVSQTVYLTSSVTDLSSLEGMQVRVWGETYKGVKAGWLMDVGRVEVLDVNGTIPE